MSITTAENDIKERLSIAYATAVTARAGCELGEVHVDRNGIDATVRAIRGTRVKIDIQLKATAASLLDEGEVPTFDLDIAGYDHLRSTLIQAPQLLVVLRLPQEPAEWIVSDERVLELRHCAYWQNLFGWDEVKNVATKRIIFPRSQIFHPEGLRDLMRRAHEKALLGQTGI